ncbi:hypothetical protein CONCODRAFT_13652 [Conidiobolus coronatus NRRL 28638]|uniref:Helix-turn-helix type 11 domain-containing protein n=1 Tax=Conidiobolus coronatus (strain ATCC 28846 / CBS 209.66 / NRRL 28638) TaxID=796925 RepID=A0A137NQC1_CONC2|nr:hypothetical protein CONCODRAFT_13652 [Conidiobolus coronatus NRRL 28638]|eukprot:KXN64947.1 hypothetical protein CONCODRAFT_13652 [Conidiobolus coronatus NRRL 28638]
MEKESIVFSCIKTGKKINSSEERIKFKPKNVGKPKKFTDESLISLANDNPDINLKELSSLVGASITAVSRRIDQINSFEERIKLKSKKAGKKSKFTDEFILNLVNANPDLKMQELGELIGISVSAISHRIIKMKNSGIRLQYSYKGCKNTRFEESQKQKIRVSNQVIIDLVNENPELKIRELAGLTKTSLSTMYRKIRIIKDGGQLLEYGNKKSRKDKSTPIRSPKKFTDGFQTLLVNESPDLNSVELPKSVDTDVIPLSNLTKKTNCGGKKVDYSSKKDLQLVSDVEPQLQLYQEG